MMARPPFSFDCAVAATLPNPVLHDPEPRQPTSLSAVFRRIADPPPAGSAPSRRRAVSIFPRRPLLLGFTEPLVDVPPIEEFLPREGEAAAPTVAELIEIAVLEPVAAKPALPEPAPPVSPPPEPASSPSAAPFRARARDLPPGPAASAPLASAPLAPAPSTPSPTQNPVDDLGRGPSEASPLPRRPTASPRPALAPMARSTQAPDHRAERQSLVRNRRLYRRAKLPAEIEIDGVPCTLIDVSIGGFAATGVPQVEPNALVPVTVRLTIDSIEVGTQLSARIIYVVQGRSSGRFVDLSPSQMAFLRYIVTWRGESVGAVGTTTLLDAISGGAERGFTSDPGESSDAPKSRWWAGLIGRKE
jgi:hypothetical protein